VKESNVFNYYLRRYKGYKKEVYLDSYWSCGTNGEKWFPHRILAGMVARYGTATVVVAWQSSVPIVAE
jgi:hypothetical protein